MAGVSDDPQYLCARLDASSTTSKQLPELSTSTCTLYSSGNLIPYVEGKPLELVLSKCPTETDILHSYTYCFYKSNMATSHKDKTKIDIERLNVEN